MQNFLNIIKPTVILEEVESKINGNVVVKRSWGLGTYIEVGGLTQSGGILNSIWGSTIKKVKKSIDPKTILILGLGGGTLAGVCKKYFPDATVTGVDIDPIMIEMGKKYLGIGEIGVNITLRDANDFIREKVKKKKRYDLVLVDLYLGESYPSGFEKDETLKYLKNISNRRGMIIFNRLYYGLKRREAVKFGKRLKKFFSKVEYYYPEANLMLICS